MNIVVRSREKYCVCRPDTSWDRENRDIYAQEAVEGYEYTPVLFVRICKAGKCISEKFASRYYDAFNFGVLLSGRLQGCRGDGLVSECLDHSSILPFPLYNPVVLENPDKHFKIQLNGKYIYSYDGGDTAMVQRAIAEVSALVSLRIGDIVAIELQEGCGLCSRSEERISLRGDFLGNEIFSTWSIF